MAVTYEAIATYTANGSQSTITFSSIPQTYTDLVLINNGASSSGGANIYALYNGDTGSNYSRTELAGTGSAASSGRNSNESLGWLGGTSLFTSFDYNSVVNIMNYSNSTTYKTILIRANRTSEQTTAVVSLWRSTSAITSMSVTLNGVNFASGSTFTLYGIKAA
jgi:hypothetical protein